MGTHFTFISDPGHGWLLVKRSELAEVGLTAADITPYSYQSSDMLGLEENVDAGIFLAAYKAKMGRVSLRDSPSDPQRAGMELHPLQG